MPRVKGWYDADEGGFLHNYQNDPVNEVYVEEIPQDTIRCEAVVEGVGGKRFDQEGIFTVIGLPAHLIGKRVQVIIIPEETN